MALDEESPKPNFDDLFSGIPQLEIIAELEDHLGLKRGFFIDLAKEDDWSFVIKFHSLIEAATTHLLVESVNKKELEVIFSRLELSGMSTGKIAFIRELNLLTKQERAFISKLSELRNSFVHKASNVGLSLEDYLGSLSTSERKGFENVIRWGHPSSKDIAIKKEEEGYNLVIVLKFLINAMMDSKIIKFAIWTGGILLLRSIYLGAESARIDRMKQELNSKLAALVSREMDIMAKSQESREMPST
jgi:hypothetical protein